MCLGKTSFKIAQKQVSKMYEFEFGIDDFEKITLREDSEKMNNLRWGKRVCIMDIFLKQRKNSRKGKRVSKMIGVIMCLK